MSLIQNSGHPTPMKASKFINRFATSTDPVAAKSKPVIRQIEINEICNHQDKELTTYLLITIKLNISSQQELPSEFSDPGIRICLKLIFSYQYLLHKVNLYFDVQNNQTRSGKI
uniref:Uncharacterized protein n=1 Tax=Micrurus spixii TaxID=129469 RepID=A0A2D4MJ20_9SAUR